MSKAQPPQGRRYANRLTEADVKNAKAASKAYKLNDGNGLVLLVKPNGSKLWRFRYRYRGKEKMIGLGQYPTVKLARARAKAGEQREILDEKADPAEVRRLESIADTNTFKAVGEDYLRKQKNRLAESTYGKSEQLLGLLVPKIGSKPIREIEPADLLEALRTIEAQGHHETAAKCRQLASRIFRFAVASGRAPRDPAADLKDALTPPKTRHRSAITDPKKLGALLRMIDTYGGQPATVAALKLLALTFTRPGELRLAMWQELDLEVDSPTWTIPAARMKMRYQNPSDHLVPLSTQAIEILTELRPVTDRGPDSYVFPSLRRGRPLSENTLNYALRNMGIGPDVHVAHGFRSTASTLLHELGFSPEVIETQLAHKRPGVAGIYNRSHLLKERQRMMQAWADALDGWKADTQAKVAALRSA